MRKAGGPSGSPACFCQKRLTITPLLATIAPMDIKTRTGAVMAKAFENKLSTPQVWILCEAHRREGEVTTKELKTEEFSRAIISYSVRRLVEKGLAKSKAVERQSLSIRLTAKGRAVAKSLT
jgi:DNA-binding MarR family transcriptional regulator